MGVEEANREKLVLALVGEAVEAEEVRRRVHVGDEGIGEGERGGELADGDLEVKGGEDGRRKELVGRSGEDLGEVDKDSASRRRRGGR